MASFTGVGDNTTLVVADKDSEVAVALSGTYNMTIELQREQGSPGSGSWETLKAYTTANATVAESYFTKSFNEKLRLIVIVDTSGTATATLTLQAKEVKSYTDDLNNTLWRAYRDADGKVVFVPNNQPVTLSASTTLTKEKHANRTIVVTGTTGIALTMPAATGTGDKYRIHYVSTVSSGSHTVVAASSADVFNGGISLSTDAAGVTLLAAATTDTITMNGSTTGGVAGTWLELTDVASGLYSLSGFLCTTGAEATPFSAGV